MALVGCLAAAGGAASDTFVEVTDTVSLPPISREVRSDDGRWSVEAVRAADPLAAVAQAGMVIIRQMRIDGGGAKVTGARVLDIAVGPRDMLVLPDGRVILLDQWLRLRDSQMALVVLSPSGEELARFSRNELAAATGQDEEEIIDLADPALGTWLSGRPRLDAKAAQLVLPVGGRRLGLDLVTLELRALTE